MKKISLLISPRAKNAYFADYLEVSKAELHWLVGGLTIVHKKIGAMDFFDIEVNDEQFLKLSMLSFVYGIFERQQEQLIPVNSELPFLLHEDFIFGAKFKGKTNETLTQMLINLGLGALDFSEIADVKLFDPMCGRGTTLLWAMQYGMKCKGIELDTKALVDFRQIVKKWCKIHRQKHELNEGFINGKAKSENRGKFIEFIANNSAMKIITGDSTNASSLLKNEKFNLLISDLPYGIHHFTGDKTRNSLAFLKACAQDWSVCLKSGGVMVLAFNRYMPKRKEMIEIFVEHGLENLTFEAPHRMSESIVRDVVIFKKS